LSTTSLLLLLPLFIVIFLLIVLTDGLPVFFSDKRIGKNLKTFNILKFRSMVSNAAEIGSFRTSKNDSRITKTGAFLRKTSLDELPQLINVLKGDMSIVGPRPDSPMQEHDYTPEEWQQRHQVRPGITGLAQTNGRSSISPEERKKLDIEYTKKVKITGDIKIILLTISQIFNKKDTN